MFQFVALEILANKLAKAAQKAVVPQLRHLALGQLSSAPTAITLRTDKDLSGRFALVAMLLTPTTAAEDTQEFERLKQVRDQVTHGSLDLGAALPPADRLLRRYLPLALDYLARGEEPP